MSMAGMYRHGRHPDLVSHRFNRAQPELGIDHNRESRGRVVPGTESRLAHRATFQWVRSPPYPPFFP